MPNYLTVNAAIAALITNVTTQVNALPRILDNSIVICEGPPAHNMPNDIIAIAERIVDNMQPHAMVGSGGPGWLIEEFEVSATIDVFRGGDDAATTRTRCYTLVNAVMQAILTDPTLAGSCYMAYPARGVYEHDYDADHEGRLARYEMAIICRSIPI